MYILYYCIHANLLTGRPAEEDRVPPLSAELVHEAGGEVGPHPGNLHQEEEGVHVGLQELRGVWGGGENNQLTEGNNNILLLFYILLNIILY